MIAKGLGIIDILVAIIFMINLFDKSDSGFPNKLVIIAGIYLLIKGIIFVLSADFFASSLDIACAVIILLSAFFSMPHILSVIVIIFLVQKGIFSFLG